MARYYIEHAFRPFVSGAAVLESVFQGYIIETDLPEEVLNERNYEYQRTVICRANYEKNHPVPEITDKELRVTGKDECKKLEDKIDTLDSAFFRIVDGEPQEIPYPIVGYYTCSDCGCKVPIREHCLSFCPECENIEDWNFYDF